MSDSFLNAMAKFPDTGPLLGLDLGTKTIGLAVSNPERTLATPLTTIRRKKFGLDAAALLELARRDVHELLVECGPTLAGAFMAQGLVDELVLYMAPRLLGNAARGFLDLPGVHHLAQAPLLDVVDVRKLGADWRMIARPVVPAHAH